MRGMRNPSAKSEIRNSKLLWSFLVLLTFVFSSCATKQKPYVAKPEYMMLQIGGYDGPSYRVRHDDRGLRYFAASDMFKLDRKIGVRVRPSAEEWNAFRKKLNEIEIWDWKSEYIDPSMSDGTSWRLIIVYSLQGDYDVVSYGSNEFPEKFGHYIFAVEELVGDRTFR